MYLSYKKNATAVSLPEPFGFPGGRGRREKCTDRTVSACRKLPERAPERKTGRNRKENRKNLSKSVDKSAGVWYYTWAPSAGQKNDFCSPAGSPWKEPIDAKSFAVAKAMNRPGGAFKQTERSCESKMEGSHPDKLTVSTEKHEAVQVRKSSKASKKDLTKNHFGGKINKSPVERLRRTGPWKLNNIEKLVTEPLCVWKNT